MSSDLLSSFLSGTAFVMGTVALVLAVYFLTRRILNPGREGDHTIDVASSVAVRVATLHALILGLVYAQELSDYSGVRATLVDEAVAVADVWHDAHRYGGDVQRPIQQGLARYLQIVVDDEWPKLGRQEGLSPQAWQQWDSVYNDILDLQPTNDRQRFLSQRMHDRVTAIARFRQLREAPGQREIAGEFWGPAILGLIFVAAAFYVYRPSRTHLILFSIFGAYSGVILFFIFAFSDPFAPPAKLEPIPFERLLDGDIGRSLQ